MLKGFFNVPIPENEPVKSYAPNSAERAALKSAIEEARSSKVDIPMYMGGERVTTGRIPHTTISMCWVILVKGIRIMSNRL